MREKFNQIKRSEDLNLTNSSQGVFSSVETSFLSIVANDNEARHDRGESLVELKTERNRHDAMDINFTWTGEDYINRSVHAFLDRDNLTILTIEVNAWRDQTRKDGSLEIRNWNHVEIDKLSEEEITKKLDKTLETAYLLVSGWNIEKLSRLQVSPPLK